LTESDAWTPVRVYVNGHLHQELRVFGQLTDVPLKALPVEDGHSARIRLEPEGDARVLMSHIDTPSETVFFKRMVTRIEGTTLQFEYEKRNPGEELLGLSLFRAASSQRARLRVTIMGEVQRDAGPHPDWTLCDRVYELQPTQTVSTPLFATGGERVFEQQQCFVRLGSDLTPARYTVQVTREDDREGYLLVSKTTPGLSERRRLSIEAEPQRHVPIEQNRS
jgi:hypothetical protein